MNLAGGALKLPTIHLTTVTADAAYEMTLCDTEPVNQRWKAFLPR